MAKNVIEFQIIVDDKGGAKLVASSMEKLSAEVDEAATKTDKLKKKTGELDRNLKGTGGITSNTTKGFAKMSQGMGGLVSVYAGLAANVFALTAAFTFFKRAADIENLAKSQEQFAATTGTSLASVTESLRDASGQLLTFKEAASAAAVGLAKGFSPKVLNDLAIGARKASTALGRDFSDAFDRLVRGVSKAEPELLDELGITLRLEDATRKYATQIGKAAKDLTAYERSQAVAVETQRQLNELFGETDPQDNAFIKLATTFDDIAKSIQSGILPLFTGLANVINNNVTSAVILFGGLSVAILKTVLPLDDLKKSFTSVFGSAKEGFEQSKTDLKTLIDSFKDVKKRQKDAFKGLQTALGPLKGASKSVDKILAGDTGGRAFKGLERSVTAALKNVDERGNITKGKFKGYSREIVLAVQAAMQQVVVVNEMAATKSLTAWQKFGAGFKVVWKGAQAAVIGAANVIGKAAAKIGNAINKAFVPFALISTAFLIIDLYQELKSNAFDVAQSILNFFQGVFNKISGLLGGSTQKFTFADQFEDTGVGEYFKGMQEAARETKRLEALTSELNEALVKASDTARRASDAIEGAGTASRVMSVTLEALRTSPLSSLVEKAVELGRANKDTSQQFEDIIRIVKKGGAAYAPFAQAILESGGDAQKLKESFRDIEESATKAVAEQKAAAQAGLDVSKSLQEGNFNSQDLLSSIIRLEEQTQEAADAAKQLNKDFAKSGKTAAELAGVSNLQKLKNTLKDIVNEQQALNAKTIRFTVEQKKLAKLGPITSKFAKTRLNIIKQTLDIQKEDLKLREAFIALNNASSTQEIRAGAERVASLEANKKALEDILELYRQSNSELGLLAKSARDSLEKELSGAIEGFILGDETSLKDAFLKATLGIGKAVTKQLSEIATNKILVGLGFETSEQESARKMEEAGQAFQDRVAELIDSQDQNLAARQEADNRAAEERKRADIANAEQLKEALNSAAVEAAKTISNSDLPTKLSDSLIDAGNIVAAAISSAADNLKSAMAGGPAMPDVPNGGTVPDMETPPSDDVYLNSAKWLGEKVSDFFNAVVNFPGVYGAEVDDFYKKVYSRNNEEDSLPVVGPLQSLQNDPLSFTPIFQDQGPLQGPLQDTSVFKDISDNINESKLEAINQVVQSTSTNQKLEDQNRKVESQTQKIAEQTQAISQVTVEGAGKICECINAATDRLVQAFSGASQESKPSALGEDIPKLDSNLVDQGLQNSETGELLAGPPVPGAGTTPIGDQAQAAAQGTGFIGKLKGAFGGFGKKISGLFSKDGGFLKGFGDIFKGGLEGFGGIFDGLLGGLGGIFQNLGGLFGGMGGGGLGGLLSLIPGVGPVLGGIASIFGFANGGYTGGFRAMAEGGIVKQPTLGLIGEGKSNEAVVPLPDGRRIPVDMSGSSGQQNNNVSVNINMEGGQVSGENEESRGQNSAMLGRLIAGAVKRELQDQQRPGGVLSPYGRSSR